MTDAGGGRRKVKRRRIFATVNLPPTEPYHEGWDGGSIFFRKDGNLFGGDYRWATSMDGVQDEVDDSGEPMIVVELTVIVVDRDEHHIKPAWWGDYDPDTDMTEEERLEHIANGNWNSNEDQEREAGALHDGGSGTPSGEEPGHDCSVAPTGIGDSIEVEEDGGADGASLHGS